VEPYTLAAAATHLDTLLPAHWRSTQSDTLRVRHVPWMDGSKVRAYHCATTISNTSLNAGQPVAWEFCMSCETLQMRCHAHQQHGCAALMTFLHAIRADCIRTSQGGPAPDVLLRLWDMLEGLSEAAPAAAQAEQWNALNAWALLPAVLGGTTFTMTMLRIDAALLNTDCFPKHHASSPSSCLTCAR